jgi:small subunit ribosomal protein S8
MSMSDPVADLLTRIRNGLSARKPKVDVPHSVLKLGVVDVLVREGYLKDRQILELDKARKVLRVFLKYGPAGEVGIRRVDRVSRPGRRLYRGTGAIPRIQGGLGITVLSTSKGVLSDREARREKVGGEILAAVW